MPDSAAAAIPSLDDVTEAIVAAAPPWLDQMTGLELLSTRTVLQKHFAEYRVHTADGGADVVLVGKVYSKPARGEASYRLLRFLYDHGMGDADRSVVRVLAWIPESAFLLMEKAPGHTLHDRLLEDPDDVEEARLAARWLLCLHAVASPDFLPAREARAEAALDRFDAELSQALGGELHDVLHRLVARLRTSVPPDDWTPVLLHGDYHPRNVFVHGEGAGVRVTAIDVDHAGRGDPAWDLGYLLGQMRVSARERWGDFTRLDAAGAAASDEYTAAMAPAARVAFLRRVARFEALALLESLHYDRCILSKPPEERDADILAASLDALDAAP